MQNPDLIYHLLLTFDYELFLGDRSGTPERCLIQPTNTLLEILKRHQAKAIFFVDALYLKKLKDLNLTEDFNRVSNQIRLMQAHNHDVFLHIHPHWKDAVYDFSRKEWNLHNITNYAISALSERELSEVIHEGYEILAEILGNGNGITGYRAGGLFIQPFTRLSKILQELNIENEFSVFPGFSSSAGGFSIDFPEINLPFTYSFSDDILKPVKETGIFKEYTINKFKFRMLNRWINSLVFRILMSKKEWQASGDGKGATHIIQNNHAKIGIFDTVKESYSVELMNPWKIKLYMKDLRRLNYLHFLSHPKLISSGNLKCLDDFLEAANNKVKVNYDFRNIPIPFNPCADSAA
jgi:hypothetical protein